MANKMKALKWWYHNITEKQREEFAFEYSKKSGVGITPKSILMDEIIEIYKENEASNS